MIKILRKLLRKIRYLFYKRQYKKQKMAYNPLTKRRNKKCLCGSGTKTKRCCGMFGVLPSSIVKKLKDAIKYEDRRDKI